MGSLSSVCAIMITTFLVTLLASTLGTFLGNLTLLYIIGVRTMQAEKKRVAAIQEVNAKIAAKLQDTLQKQRDYIRMES